MAFLESIGFGDDCFTSADLLCRFVGIVVLVQHHKDLSTGNNHNLCSDGFGILFKGLDGGVTLSPTLDVVDLLPGDAQLPRQFGLSHSLNAESNQTFQNLGHEQLPNFRCR